MGAVTTAEHLQIYKQSGGGGTDTEGRGGGGGDNREANLMERIVLMFIKLYRSFPGYNSLPIADQVAVLKGQFVVSVLQ